MIADQIPKTEYLIEAAYNGFNNRDIDRVLLLMDKDIHWPKAFEGGYVIGKEAIREYWTRQWSEINPIVKLQTITVREDGKVAVLVHQLVKDLAGNLLFDGDVKHVYQVKNDLLLQMILKSFSIVFWIQLIDLHQSRNMFS